MITYLIDENMPFLPFWNKESFILVIDLPLINSDSDIWEYALKNELVIVTKDSDFYYRYLSSNNNPKIVWISTGNLKKSFLFN